jgi:hypothetical protein
MITIQELLEKRLKDAGLSINDRAKMVRHKEVKRKIDLYNFYRNEREKFLFYQSTEWDDIFKETDYIVSFIGEEGTLSRFVGVYKIKSSKKFDTTQPDLEVRGIKDGYNILYEMEDVSGFEDLKERVIIDWGKGTLAWCQNLRNIKEIKEITPGFDAVFPGYPNVILKFEELKNIIEKSYPVWKKMLSAVNCIYAILDNSNGKMYVGSTYGKDGIWGRWSKYVQTKGHGNNVVLEELIKADETYANKYFTFSILHILPINVSLDLAVKEEILFKNKLGTIKFGYNKN